MVRILIINRRLTDHESSNPSLFELQLIFSEEIIIIRYLIIKGVLSDNRNFLDVENSWFKRKFLKPDPQILVTEKCKLRKVTIFPDSNIQDFAIRPSKMLLVWATTSNF